MIISIILIASSILALIFAFYLAIFAWAGRRYQTPSLTSKKEFKKIAVVIPAYREDQVILRSVLSVTTQDYPKSHFDVFVVADGLQMPTIKELANVGACVIPVSFKNSTKVKALKAFVASESGYNFDAVTILDADNIMDSLFLERTNQALCQGFRVIQGVRKPKNSESIFARLDAVTEDINTTIFRKGHQVLGLPSALTGSGMTFSCALFESLLVNATAVGGFDKEMELSLTKANESILFDDAAIVYDEKVHSSNDLTRQRSRWMGAQWHYAATHLSPAWTSIKTKSNGAYLDKVFQMVMPPRILLLTGQVLAVPLAILTSSFIAAILFSTSLFLTLFALIYSISEKNNFRSFVDVFRAPIVLAAYFKGFAKSFKANRRFVHTQHKS